MLNNRCRAGTAEPGYSKTQESRIEKKRHMYVEEEANRADPKPSKRRGAAHSEKAKPCVKGKYLHTAAPYLEFCLEVPEEPAVPSLEGVQLGVRQALRGVKKSRQKRTHQGRRPLLCTTRETGSETSIAVLRVPHAPGTSPLSFTSSFLRRMCEATHHGLLSCFEGMPTAQHSCPRHNIRAHGATFVPTVQHSYPRCNIRAYGATFVPTVQHSVL